MQLVTIAYTHVRYSSSNTCFPSVLMAHHTYLRFLIHPRRWDYLVQKPLHVSSYSLSLRQAQDLLRSVGMSSALIRRAFDTFARRRERSSSWSRALGEAPERRIDALELFSGLALTCRAPLKEKLSILFYLFDSAETGVLTEDDLGAMISSCASVLRHLKLSLPISNDEAAFAAGAAFGHQQHQYTGSSAGGCGCCELEHETDDIDLPLFLTWAQQAELPSYALEILALPHRLSRMVDLVSSKTRSTLRERYSLEAAAIFRSPYANSITEREVSSETAPNQLSPERRAPVRRLNRANILPLLQGGGSSFNSKPFFLPPYLGRIGPHSANALFEVSTGNYPTASDSSWLVVVSVEERCGSRFSLVDSQPLNVRVGAPGVIVLSNLRAATDHRLTISWGVAAETRKNGDLERNNLGGQHGRAECSTLRFTTLPADSLMASPNSDSKRFHSSFSNEMITSMKQRRCIKLGSGWQQEACPFDEALRLRPYPRDDSYRHPASSKGVSVLISHGQRTCLESSEPSGGRDPWWGARAGSTARDPHSSDKTDTRVLVQSWPQTVPASENDLSVSSTGSNTGECGAFSNIADFAPFCGETDGRSEVPVGQQAYPWARSGEVEAEGIDLMVHLSPDWRAVEVVRRCFQVLRHCRLESPSIREDGRRTVCTEVNKAVRSLATRCFRARRGMLRDKARRSSAHIVLGDLQHPWLGLREVGFLFPYSACGRQSPSSNTPAVGVSRFRNEFHVAP